MLFLTSFDSRAAVLLLMRLALEHQVLHILRANSTSDSVVP